MAYDRRDQSHRHNKLEPGKTESVLNLKFRQRESLKAYSGRSFLDLSQESLAEDDDDTLKYLGIR